MSIITTEASASLIRRVIEDRLVRIVYQPIVSVRTRELFAYEALVRSATPELAGPTELFDAAVAHNCAGELGRVVRQLAVEGCPHHALFLNVHPAELDDLWLIQFDDPASCHLQPVMLEITESVPLARFSLCNAVLAELRERGISLVVDDLGAGYSNLKYIADLEPSAVKLDRKLITGLRINTRMFRLVAGIIALCHDLGCLVVAEGIETPEEFHAAEMAGVDLAQGYLLARPAFPLPEATLPPPLAFCDRPTLRRRALRGSTGWPIR